MTQKRKMNMKNYFLRPPVFEELVQERFSQGFYIFETFLLHKNEVPLASFHLDRLQQSLIKLKWPLQIEEQTLNNWWQKLLLYLNKEFFACDQRIKLILIPDFRSAKLIPYLQKKDFLVPQSPLKLCLHPQALRHSQDPIWSFKWGERVRMQYFLKEVSPKFDDVIFINEKEQICETSRHNIYIKKNNLLYTPHVTCGLLPGVMRTKLLKENKVQETFLTLKDLKDSEEIFVSNALIGLVPANLKDFI